MKNELILLIEGGKIKLAQLKIGEELYEITDDVVSNVVKELMIEAETSSYGTWENLSFSDVTVTDETIVFNLNNKGSQKIGEILTHKSEFAPL